MTDLSKYVKPLVWETDEPWRHMGRVPFKCANWCYWVMESNGQWRVMGLEGQYDTPEEAKAAAQADYASRILSALNLDAFGAACDGVTVGEAAIRKAASKALFGYM